MHRFQQMRAAEPDLDYSDFLFKRKFQALREDVRTPTSKLLPPSQCGDVLAAVTSAATSSPFELVRPPGKASRRPASGGTWPAVMDRWAKVHEWTFEVLGSEGTRHGPAFPIDGHE